jgi:hypothetical protein
MNARTFVLAALAWGLLAPPAAALPASFTYQGNLWENGLPVTSTKTMTFRVTDPTGAATYWASGALSVFVDRGHFAAQLSPTGVDWNSVSPRLEVTVGGVALSPLQALDAVPYSFLAGSVEGGVTLTPSGTPPAAARGRLYFDSNGVGALKVSLDGTSFISVATGTGGSGGLSTIASDAGQFSGDGSGGTPLALKASSVTLQGNAFNGAGQLLMLDPTGKIPATVIASSVAAAAVDTVQLKDGGVTDAKIAGMSSSKLTGALPALDGSALTGVTDATKLLKAGDTMTGDLQVGGAAASTVSASGFVTMANLVAPPSAARGRLFFDPAGDGALKVSLDGASFVRLATGTAGAGLSVVAADASQLSGDGTGGSPMTLKSSSVTLQGNAFNGANQLLQLDTAGKLPATVIASSVAAAAVDTVQLKDAGVTDSKIVGMSSSKLSGALPALDGSALTGVNDGTKVSKAGDTMSGQLTIAGSSLTVSRGVGVGGAGLEGATMVVRSTSTTGGHAALAVQGSGGTGLLRVQEDGKVGIGTSSPGARLEVATPGGSAIQFDTSNPAYGSVKINGVEVARILP